MKNSIIFALIAYNILLNNSHAFSDDHDSSQDDMEYVYQEGDFQSTETSTTEEYQEPVDPTNDHGSSMDEDSEENSSSNHTTEASEENSDALYDEEGYLIWVPIYRMAAENAEANMIQWLADALAKKDWKQLRFMLMSFNKLDELGFNFFHTVILNGHSKLLKYIFNNFDSLYTKNTRMDDPVKTLQIILTTSVDSRNAHYPSWSVFQLALLAEDLELFATLINSAIEHELPIQHSILQFHSKLNFIQKIQQKPLGHLRVLMLLGSFYGDAQLPYAIDAAFVKNILQDIFSIYYQYQHDEKLLKFFHEIAFGFFYRTDCFDILESFIIEKATQSDPARIMSFLQWLSKSRFQTHKAIHTEVLIPNSKLLSSAFYIDLYFAIFNCRYLEQRLLSLYKHALSTLSSSCGGLTVDQVFQQLQG